MDLLSGTNIDSNLNSKILRDDVESSTFDANNRQMNTQFFNEAAITIPS
jgi:hypothetical protein